MRMKKKGEKNGMMIFAVLAVIAVLFYGGNQGWFKGTAGTSVESIAKGTAGESSKDCNSVPAYTYSAMDAFTSLAVTKTDYIKADGQLPVTSLAAPPVGNSLQYLPNVTNYVCEKVDVEKVNCGSNLVQSKCYNNGSVSIKFRDLDEDATLTATTTTGATNLSVDANGRNNVEIRFQGTAKKPNMPLGGCIAIEYPTTISSITLNGAGISSAVACPHVWTYAVGSTSNTFRTYAIPAGFDVNGLGDLKAISAQVAGGASETSAGNIKVTFQPAGWYVAQDGNFYLGIEKDRNQDSTKVVGAGETASVATS
jgi:hypothetical protein